MSVAIVDYGLGNLRSVAGAVERLGFEPVITADTQEIAAADRLILPGVGAFGDGMDGLRARGLVDVLSREVCDKGKPILGICLGFQLVAKASEEFGRHEGLGWLDATVVRLSPSDPHLRVPHVGWDDVERAAPSLLFDGVPEDALFYFTHSYCMQMADDSVVIGRCDYGGPFTAAVQSGNIFATQFHPEKSQQHGLTLLRNFLGRA